MTKQYLIKGLLFLLMSGLISSCSKDEDDFMTSGEINAKKIQAIIDKEHPSVVSVYEFQWNDFLEKYDWKFIVGTSVYKIEGVFIKVDIYYFN